MLTAHLTHYLHTLGHRITVVSPRPGPMREEFEARGARVVVCPAVLMTPYALDELFSAPDVVLANTILSWRVVVTARAAGKPCVWIVHESNFGSDYARAHPSIAQAFTSATRVVFPSLETEGRYRHFNAGRQMVIHYGIEPVSARRGVRKVTGKAVRHARGQHRASQGAGCAGGGPRSVPPRVRQKSRGDRAWRSARPRI